MKQTAVEWFIEKTIESGHLWVTDTPSDMTELRKLIEHAKQMEREQIVEASHIMYMNGTTKYPITAEQYYNETFKESIPQKPKPPLSKVLKEGGGHFCNNCNSTSSKVGFLGLFGERLCDNQECPNSRPKKNYR
jgi:hypothetical protein